MRILAYIALSCALLSSNAWSQAERGIRRIADDGDRFALLIGINDYPDAPLRNAVNDARDLGTLFTDLGFHTDVLIDADKQQIERAIDQFVERLGKGAIGAFYFSGHGLQIEGINYLVPADFNAGDTISAKYASYPVDLLRERMEASGTQLNLIILDACRNNPFRSTRSLQGGLAAMKQRGKTTYIAMATGPGSTADDNHKGRNGLFTHYLLESLRMPALELDDVFKRTGAKVDSASHGKQQPWRRSNLYEDFFLRNASYVEPPPSLPAQVSQPVAASEEKLDEWVERGRAFRYGKGVPQDYDKAMQWFRRAADAGSAYAWANIGFLYSDGLGVEKNYAEAARHYKRAANAGSSMAQINLGVLYEKGEGVEQDYGEALKWYQVAAENTTSSENHIKVAAANIGYLYLKGRLTPSKEPNYSQARDWFSRSADLGHDVAQYELGQLYYNGQGVKRNYATARRWFELAAEQGYASAQARMGDLHHFAQGIPQSNTEAVRWYRQAAEQGHARAQFNLGVILDDGTRQNYAEAVRWYRRAAEQGYANAQKNLGDIYLNGRAGIDQDIETGLSWIRKAVDQGDGELAYRIGSFYEREGTESVRRKWANRRKDNMTYGMALQAAAPFPEKDLDQALHWYRLALEHGYEKANERIQALERR